MSEFAPVDVGLMDQSSLHGQVAARLGVLPNFFCTAASAPGLIERLWDFARSAYFDSPLPSLFKERLFVHLSRFCEVRYCIVRHVGFLVGHGYPAGDRDCPPQSIDQVVSMLERAVPSEAEFAQAMQRLQVRTTAFEMPTAGTQCETDLFDALTLIFLEPRRSAVVRQALAQAYGEANLEMLTAFLAFVRTAHFWTETHPELEIEPDMLTLMQEHADLERLLLDQADAERTWSPMERARLLSELAVHDGKQKAAAKALAELNATLEEKVAARTRELLASEEALRQSQKMEAIGQLTGGIAHDFNNLLTIIRSSIDFLRRPELPRERKQRYLDAVSDTVDRAAKLTSQLLAFSRRQSLTPEVFEVGGKLRDITDMVDSVTGSRMRVVMEIPEEPCFIRADLSQFETALINMAVNARDAMDGEGTVTLRLESAAPMPALRGHAGSQIPFVSVSVTDTGSGISSDHLQRIFEPFFTTKEVGKGTGLGLSQVFGFAKQSGGDVDVKSVVGQGATFILYLPEVAIVTATPQPVERSRSLAPVGTGQRVLVVEDNIEVGRFCTQILEDLGYVTEWAVNAEDALAKLGTDGNGFDVVFSDVVMPGMGGVALAELLRERMPRLPVVLASGYSHVLARGDEHGFELLHKPYSAEQLARVLREIIAKVAYRNAQEAAS